MSLGFNKIEKQPVATPREGLRINGWMCDTCGFPTYAVEIHEGVTPFFLSCRAEGKDPADAKCKGQGQSLMYPQNPPQHVLDEVRWEWYTPVGKDFKGLHPATQQHVLKGGLNLRPLTDEGRKILANQNPSKDGVSHE